MSSTPPGEPDHGLSWAMTSTDGLDLPTVYSSQTSGPMVGSGGIPLPIRSRLAIRACMAVRRPGFRGDYHLQQS
jgi:hypothetical protein